VNQQDNDRLKRMEKRSMDAEGREAETHRLRIQDRKVIADLRAEIARLEALASENARACERATYLSTDAINRASNAAATVKEANAALAAAGAREFALGVQVQAQAARLKLAEACVEAARLVVPRWLGSDLGVRTLKPLQDALAAFDAVPGDVGVEVLPNGDGTASAYRVDDLTARWVGPDGEPER